MVNNGKTIKNYKVIVNKIEVNLISMYKDNNVDLWLGTLNKGTFKFNRNILKNSNLNDRNE